MSEAIQNLRRHLLDPSFVRYLIVGGTIFLVYTGGTLLLAEIGLPFGLAIAVSYVISVSLHFVLQREFVFKHDAGFHISTRDQIKRYLIIGVIQYSITWTATRYLPEQLGLSEQVIYVATVVVISVVGFLVLRLHVFAPARVDKH